MKFLVLSFSGQMYKGASHDWEFSNSLAICSYLWVSHLGACQGDDVEEEEKVGKVISGWGMEEGRKNNFLLFKKLKQCMEVQEQNHGCFAAH